ncbi:hypothetical protein JST97_11875 [bacterium]|nr:hypothetical protein [bacterium]
MRVTLALLSLALLGCQSTSVPPQSNSAPPSPLVTQKQRPEQQRRPLVRLNPRRQSLEVGEAPPAPELPRRVPMKVGVRVLPESPPRPAISPPQPGRLLDPRQQQIQSLNESLAAQHQQIQRQNEAILAEQQRQREQIQRQNEAILAQTQQAALWNNRPLPGQDLTPQMQQVAYPQVGASDAHRQAERRYLEARADFLNTKYLPPGSPPRYNAENVRGQIGTGMPLPPDLMSRPATFNPVLQKAQQAEILRQEMVRIP